MKSLFNWNESFLTRIESVDEQHKHLVSLINDLGEMVMSGDELDLEAFGSVRDGVLEYVGVHFRDEESMMREIGLDPRHIQKHEAAHKVFVTEAMTLSDTGSALSSEEGRELTNFLVHWLAYHILDVDQSMGRQVHAVQAGMSAEEAYEQESKSRLSSTEPLLQAMSGLFYMVSQRNRELRAFNRELEQRVKQRTLELEEANQRLHQLSTEDELTGLPNRRFAMLTLNQHLKEKKRYGGSLSILLLDADRFKQVNDRFGHAQGDALLRTLAGRLRESVRKSDIVCRLGGDEFLIICPQGGLSGALQVGRKVLAESRPFFTPDGEECWNGALSIGAAEAADDTARPDDLLHAADKALYESKRKGGAQVS